MTARLAGQSIAKRSLPPFLGRRGLLHLAVWLTAFLAAAAGPGAEAREAKPPMPDTRASLPPLGEAITDEQARLELARLLAADAKGVGEAISHYHRLLGKDPGNDELTLELSELLVRSGRYGEAVSLLRDWRRYAPALRLRAAVALARAAAGTGDLPAALALLEPLRREHPQHREIGLESARIQARMGRPQKASAIAAGLTSAWPDDPRLHVAAARLESDLGHPSAAGRYYERAAVLADEPARVRLEYAARLPIWGDFYRSDDIYRELLAETPGNTAIQRKRAESLTGAQRYAEAEGIYRRLLLDGDAPKPLLWLDVARTRFAAKDDALALEAVGRILDPAGENAGTSEPSCTVQPLSGALYLTVSLPGDFQRVTTFSLTAPHRLVLDLHGMAAAAGGTICRVDAAGVARLRWGSHPDRTRLVVDAADPGFGAPAIVYGDRTLHLVFPDEASTPSARSDAPERRRLADILVDAFVLKADLLARAGKTEEAVWLQRFRRLVPGQKAAAELELGRLYRRMGDEETAAGWFAHAMGSDPDAPAVRFFHTGPEAVQSDRFVRELIDDPHRPPMELVEWGRLFNGQGWYAPAAACFSRAAERDPECFPARLALGETLAYDRRFDEAFSVLASLAGEHPGNRKGWVAWARALSWAKRYEEAVDVYDAIQRRDLSDPLPRMESARTAVWAKQMEQARERYAALWNPSVDRLLFEGMAAVAPQEADSLIQAERDNPVYGAFERFFAATQDPGGEWAAAQDPTRHSLRLLAAELWSAYRVQKEAWLEYQAKQLAWDHRIPGALEVYRALLGTRPGNQEALFDTAQVACSLGLCAEEERTYRTLLRMEPNHTLAQEAMQRLRVRNRPYLGAAARWWDEQGGDRLSDIRRFRTDAVLDVPVSCRYRLQLEAHRWQEEPGPGDAVYRAAGHSLGATAVFSPHWVGSARWTHKDYTDSNAGRTDTGALSLGYRADGGGVLTLGFDRMDESANSYAIRQGTQSASLWGRAEWPLRRRWDLEGEVRSIRYSDDNDGWSLRVAGTHALTDHPRRFVVGVSAAYRDTREPSAFLTDENGDVVDVLHPYWTPSDHLSGALTLEWYHDLARDFFCGARRHFYDLKLSLGAESEDNALVRLEGEWRYDFQSPWSVAVNGLLHRSRQWDASGVWASLQYRLGGP